MPSFNSCPIADAAMTRRISRPALAARGISLLAALALGGAASAQTNPPLVLKRSFEGAQSAQADPGRGAPPARQAAPAKPAAVKRAPPPKPQEPQPAPEASAPNGFGGALPVAAAGAASNLPAIDELQRAQVRTCLPGIDAVARQSLQGVSQFKALSTWNTKEPDTHLIGMIMGQRFGNGDLNAGLTGVFASPSGPTCDTMALQVVPSARSCPDLQQAVLSAQGRDLGDLVGLNVLINRVGRQVTLVPSAGNGCVIVSLQVGYTP